MAIPLPQYESPVRRTLGTASQVNALMGDFANELLRKKQKEMEMQQTQAAEERKNQLFPEELKKIQMQNELFMPQTQADIANKTAQTNRLNFQQQNPLYGQAGPAGQIGAAELLRRNPQLASDPNAANIIMNALTKNEQQKMVTPRMGVGNQAYESFNQQIASEHPEWNKQQLNDAVGTYIQGGNISPSGEKLPSLSGSAQYKLNQMYRYNAPTSVQNQAANMAITAQDLKEIPIDEISKYSGVLGKIDYANELRKMQTNPNSVSPEFRQYKAYQDTTSILAMDTLRKGFGTSVVPGYVYDTLGKALNPQSSWWNDPKQVSMDLKKTISWVTKNSEMLQKQVRQGVTADLSKENNKKTSNKEDLTKLSDKELMDIING